MKRIGVFISLYFIFNTLYLLSASPVSAQSTTGIVFTTFFGPNQSNADFSEMFSATTDTGGNIYVAADGDFNPADYTSHGFPVKMFCTISQDVGPDTSNNERDLMVAKFSPDGQPLWVTFLGGTKVEREATGIAVDNAGNVYFTLGIVNPNKTHQN